MNEEDIIITRAQLETFEELIEKNKKHKGENLLLFCQLWNENLIISEKQAIIKFKVSLENNLKDGK